MELFDLQRKIAKARACVLRVVPILYQSVSSHPNPVAATHQTFLAAKKALNLRIQQVPDPDDVSLTEA